jgi:hypothetical protein
MSLVVRCAKCLSHRISSTLSSFCEGDPLEREEDPVGGIGEFWDALLLWVALESLGIYRKTDGQRGVVRVKGMKNFSWSVNFKRWLGALTEN